jgi:hypothetical protein
MRWHCREAYELGMSGHIPPVTDKASQLVREIGGLG